MKQLSIVVFTLLIQSVIAQNNSVPYYEIPEYPEQYNACNVAARMIDGLGFRFHWATESLTENDLKFKPSNDARTTSETIDHIYGLSKVILNSTLHKPNIRVEEDLTYSEKRIKTLENLKTASDILKQSDDLSKFTIVFGENEFPFWNQINGPIADAIWHSGQIVSFRRSSGNPFNSKASLFSGKLRE